MEIVMRSMPTYMSDGAAGGAERQLRKDCDKYCFGAGFGEGGVGQGGRREI